MTIGSDQLDAWGKTLIRRLRCAIHGHEYSHRNTYTEYLNGYIAVYIHCQCGKSILAEIRNPNTYFRTKNGTKREDG